MPVYSATFTGIAVSAAQDLIELVMSANNRGRILEIRVGQYSDAGDAAAELASIQIIRGFTTSGSGGASVTPGSVKPWSRASAATVERNNTTLAQDGTGVTLVSDTFNVAAGWFYKPDLGDKSAGRPDESIEMNPSDRLVVRMPNAPADALSFNFTIVWEEMGKMPVS